MMKKLIPLLGLLVLTGACERLVEEVPLSPLNVYPNPFTTTFSIYINLSLHPSNSRLRVFNGKEEDIAVFNNLRGGGQVQIDMRSQPAGAYFVEYQFDDQVIVETVLKTE